MAAYIDIKYIKPYIKYIQTYVKYIRPHVKYIQPYVKNIQPFGKFTVKYIFVDYLYLQVSLVRAVSPDKSSSFQKHASFHFVARCMPTKFPCCTQSMPEGHRLF